MKIDYDLDKQEILKLYLDESDSQLFVHEGNYKFTSNNTQQDELLFRFKG